MRELNKAGKLEVAGPLAEKALAAFAGYLRQWGLVMPVVIRMLWRR